MKAKRRNVSTKPKTKLNTTTTAAAATPTTMMKWREKMAEKSSKRMNETNKKIIIETDSKTKVSIIIRFCLVAFEYASTWGDQWVKNNSLVKRIFIYIILSAHCLKHLNMVEMITHIHTHIPSSILHKARTTMTTTTKNDN